MIGSSFDFIDKNSFEDFGIKCVAVDVILPQKRVRKISIPGVNGQYDYGSRNYEEREINITCVLTRKISRAETREIAYWLSQKGRLTLWDEEDKYYMAEIYNPSEIVNFPNEIQREFEITFIAEPFAYKDVPYTDIKEVETAISYEGTAKTPCLLVLKNETNQPIQIITITATQKRR